MSGHSIITREAAAVTMATSIPREKCKLEGILISSGQGRYLGKGWERWEVPDVWVRLALVHLWEKLSHGLDLLVCSGSCLSAWVPFSV